MSKTPTPGPTRPALRVIIADDEAPARARMSALLGDIKHDQPTEIIAMVGNGQEALRALESAEVDVILADIRMPLVDGILLAETLKTRTNPPQIIFTTAYDEYSLKAFDVSATDYLVKPVRAIRLAEALERVRTRLPQSFNTHNEHQNSARECLCVNERGRVLFLPVNDVLYLKAELKYVTARTAERSYLLDDSLVQLEEEFKDRFLRIHRNCLVAKASVRGVERAPIDPQAEHPEMIWQIILNNIDERLVISRRQWSSVKTALGID